MGMASNVPVDVLAIDSAVYVSAGAHTCAVLSDGTARCWGLNTNGQLGDGTKTFSDVPVLVDGLSNIVSITAAHSRHTCALLDDRTVWCWGANDFGQLGDGAGDGLDNPTAVQVSGLSNVTQIDTGAHHTCAVREDGTVWCWGSNFEGALGDGTAVQVRETPVQVVGITTAVSVAAAYSPSCAVLEDGTAWCWGKNGDGQLGHGGTEAFSTVPVQVSGLATVTAVTAGEGHACALLEDTSAWCWGDNSDSQLGTEMIILESNVPVPVQPF
jgi:alpha-tubulin suppressor-like RCC1 family protein